MKIGCLGKIVFEVSDKEMKTIRDASWSSSASIATHQRHLGDALQEFVGSNPDSFEFKIRVSRFLGSDPEKDIETLLGYVREGIVVPLTIGKKSYGKYRWLVQKVGINLENYDRTGNLVGVDLSVTLTEYTKG